MDPDGILNGWNNRVRITSAMRRAWNTTRPPSASPPSLRFPSVDTLIDLSSFEMAIDFSTALSATSCARLPSCALIKNPLRCRVSHRLTDPKSLTFSAGYLHQPHPCLPPPHTSLFLLTPSRPPHNQIGS